MFKSFKAVRCDLDESIVTSLIEMYYPLWKGTFRSEPLCGNFPCGKEINLGSSGYSVLFFSKPKDVFIYFCLLIS